MCVCVCVFLGVSAYVCLCEIILNIDLKKAIGQVKKNQYIWTKSDKNSKSV